MHSPTIALTLSTCPPTAARCRHVSPRLFLTVTDAPAAISIWQISPFPASEARWRAVSPHSFRSFSLARHCLDCNRRRTMSVLPSRTEEKRSNVVILAHHSLNVPDLLHLQSCFFLSLSTCNVVWSCQFNKPRPLPRSSAVDIPLDRSNANFRNFNSQC